MDLWHSLPKLRAPLSRKSWSVGYDTAGVTSWVGGMGTQVQSHQGQGRLPNGTLKLVLTQRQTDTERDAGKL